MLVLIFFLFIDRANLLMFVFLFKFFRYICHVFENTEVLKNMISKGCFTKESLTWSIFICSLSFHPCAIDGLPFFCIYWISVRWSWNLSSSMLANFLRAISKADLRIFFPIRFVEGHGYGDLWVFRIVGINWLLCFI